MFLCDAQIKSLCLTPTHRRAWHDGTSQRVAYYHLTNEGELYHLGDRCTPTPAANLINGALEEIRLEEIAHRPKPLLENAVMHQVRHRDIYFDLREPFGSEKNPFKNIEELKKYWGSDMGWDIDGDIAKKPIVSYGLTSFGYDVRLADEFKIFTNINNSLIDPLDMDPKSYVDVKADSIIIPPNSYALGHTVEYFNMQRDLIAICLGKSTYARAGLAVNVTPIEPDWHGQVVLELANQTPLPIRVHANMGIAQFLFARGEKCDISYADRGGKYQGQTGVTTARV